MLKKREITEKEQKEWLDKYNKELQQEEEKFKKITSDTDYISWLETFTNTKTNKTFTTAIIEYYSEGITSIDKENIKNLDLLFEGIETYARKNFIYPSYNKYGIYYPIKYNNVGYKIGILDSLGTPIFFCIRTNIEESKNYLDFNYILNNKEQTRTTKIKNNLQQLSDLIHSLANENVPLEAISETTENTIKLLKKEKRNNIR